jgi:hypothetical protein
MFSLLQQEYDENDAYLKKHCNDADAELDREQEKCLQLQSTIKTLEGTHIACYTS